MGQLGLCRFGVVFVFVQNKKKLNQMWVKVFFVISWCQELLLLWLMVCVVLGFNLPCWRCCWSLQITITIGKYFSDQFLFAFLHTERARISEFKSFEPSQIIILKLISHSKITYFVLLLLLGWCWSCSKKIHFKNKIIFFPRKTSSYIVHGINFALVV